MNEYNNPAHAGTPEDPAPSLSTEYDILSHALHHTGYWPERSLIILTAYNECIGPLLRVDLPEDPEPLTRRAAYLDEIFNMLPVEYRGHPLNRFYALIIDGDNTVRQRQLNPEGSTQASIVEIGADLTTQNRISSWAHLLFDPRIVANRRCEDIIYAGSTTLWALNSAQDELVLLGPIEDLLTCRHHTWCIRHNKHIAPHARSNFEHSPWDTDITDIPEQREDWESAVELWTNARIQCVNPATTGTIHRQAQVDLCYWETAINAAEALLIHHESRGKTTGYKLEESANAASKNHQPIGDALRELIPAEIAGYLRASLAPYALTDGDTSPLRCTGITPETLVYLAGHGLDRAQQALSIQRYIIDYLYYALGGSLPGCNSPADDTADKDIGRDAARETLSPLEPPHYGTSQTRKARIPESFSAALTGDNPCVRAVPHKCVQWLDWIRRTHRRIQSSDLARWELGKINGIDLAESSFLHEQAIQRLIEELSEELNAGLTEETRAETRKNTRDNTWESTPDVERSWHVEQELVARLNDSDYLNEPHRKAIHEHYRATLRGEEHSPSRTRLNALEIVSSLLIPGAHNAEYAALRTLQAWITWTKGHSTYASLLREEAIRVAGIEETPNLLDLHILRGIYPAWVHQETSTPDYEGTFCTLKPRSIPRTA